MIIPNFLFKRTESFTEFFNRTINTYERQLDINNIAKESNSTKKE